MRSPPGSGFRLAAAALAAVPVGFAAGALLCARLLVPTAESAALAILGGGAFGAVALALLAGGAAAALPAGAARLVAFVLGGASFAVMVFVVRDFVLDRMAQGRAFDAAYAQVPAFAFTVTAGAADRRPFAELAYESADHAYSAVRPGGWRCTGNGRRRDHVALFAALGALESAPVDSCPRRAAWRIDDAPEAAACLDADAPLLAAADVMVEATARRAVCQRLGPRRQQRP